MLRAREPRLAREADADLEGRHEIFVPAASASLLAAYSRVIGGYSVESFGVISSFANKSEETPK